MKCCVSCCIVSGKRFVHFPIKNEQLFEKWIENINDPLLFKNKDYQTIYKTHLVCTKHFEKRMLQDKPKRSRVLKNAYPTLFLRKEYPYHIVPVSKDEIDGQYVNPVYEDPLDLLSVDKSAANRDTYKNDVRVKFGCLSLSPIKTSGKKKTKNTVTSSTGKINQSAIVSSTVPNLDIEVKPVASVVLKQISPTITSKQMENGHPSPEDLNKSKDNNLGRRSLRSRKMKEDELTVNKSDQEQLTEMSKAVDEIKMDDTVHRINLKKFIKEVDDKLTHAIVKDAFGGTKRNSQYDSSNENKMLDAYIYCQPSTSRDNPPITTSDPQTSSYQGIKSNFSPLRQISPVRQGSRRKFISEKSPTKSPVVKNNSPKNKETVSIETISLIAAIKPCWVVLEKLTDTTISALLNNVKTEQKVTEDSPPRTRSRLQKLIEIDTEKRDCDPKLNTSSHKKLNPAKVDSSGSENKHPVCTRNLRSRKLTESSSTLSTSVNTEENGPEPVRSSSAEFKLLIINKQRNYIENIESPKKKDDGNSQDIDYETDAFVKEELQITEQYLDQNDMKTSFDQLEINIEESDPDQSTDIVEEPTSSSNIDETEMTQVIKSPKRIESEDQSRNICENILTVQLNKELITPNNSPKVSKENLSIDENSAETPSPKHLKSGIDSSKSKEEILSSENTITVQLNKELITSNNSPKVSKEKLSIDENLKETPSPKHLKSGIDSSKSKEKILSSENILTVQLNKELITPNNSPKVSQEQLSIEENSEEMSIEEKSEEIQSPIDDLQSCINSSKSKEILSTEENEEIVKDIQSQPSEKILTVQLNKELITPDNSPKVSKENFSIEENSEAMSIEEINSSKSKEILSTEKNKEIVNDIQSKSSEKILTVQLNEELITPDNSSNVSKEKLSIEENAEEIQSPKRLKSEINSSVSKATEGKLEIVKHIQSKSSVEENTEITSSSEITEEILTVKENHTEIVKDIRITKLKQSTRTLMTSISPEANEPILRVEENKEIMELSRRLELKIYPSKTNEDILSVEKTEKDINHSEPQLISSKPTELLPLDETEHEIIKSPEHSEPNLHSLSASDETENIEKSSTHLKPKYLSPKTSDKFSSNEEMELVIKNTQIIPILKSSEHILSNKTTNDSHKKSVKSREVKSPSKTFQKVMSVEVIVKDKDIKTPKYLNSKHLPPKTSEPTVNLEDKIRKSWKRLAYNLNKPQAKKQKIVNPNDSTLQTSIVPNQISIEYDSFPISNDDATESTSSISSGDTYDVGFSPVQSTPPSSVTSLIDEYSSPLTPDTLKNLDSENDTFNRTVPTDTIIIDDDYDELIATVNKSMNVLEPIIIESHLEDHSTYCKTVSPVSEICAEISLPKKSVTPSKSPNKIKILDNIVIHAAQSQQTTASEQPSTSYSEFNDKNVNIHELSTDAEQQSISQMKPYYKFADGTNYQLELISYIKKPPVSKLGSRVCVGNKNDVSELTTEFEQKSIPFDETIDLSSDNEEVIDTPPSTSSTMNGKKRKLNHHYRANNKRFREEVPKIITQIKNSTSKSLCWKKINDSYHRIFEMSRHDSDFSWLANLVGPTDYRTLDFIWSCKDDKRTEFSLIEKSQACALMHRTGKLYDYLVKYYNLPSRKMLMQFLNKIHIQPGINDGRNEQFIQLNNRGVNKNNYCVLSFDEIKINSRFTYDEEEDSIIGFQHSNEHENSIFLSRVLVFMLRGVSEFRRWQQPYAFMFLTNQTKPAKVVQYIKDVIKSALSANFDIIATVCKPKQLFCDSYEILRKETNEYCRTYKFKYDEKVIIVNGKDIVPLYDTLDLIRIFRNRFIKKNISFQMNYQPFEANWNDIIDFYQYDTNQSEIRSKLEDSYVLPDKIRKFDRKTIPNIFEHSVYTGMLLLLTEASPGLHKLKQSARGTAYLIKMFSKLLDSFSLAGNNEILNKQVLSKRFNTWHDTEQTLKSFKFSDKSKNITFKDSSIKRLLDNIKNIDYLCKSLQHRCTIDLRITNFDALEDLLNFVQIKKTPTPYQFISAFKSYCINPCSTDVLLTNLDHYLINPPPVIAVEKIQIAPEKIINSTLKRSKQSDMYIKKITARYLIKLTSNCKNCHAKLLRSETSGICSWKVILKSDLFTVIFNQLLKITSRLVPLEYNRTKIKTIIASYIDKYIDISNIFCPRHDLSKKFINVVVKLYLKFWCRSINEILTGESTMRKSKMDLVQSVASLYYTQNNE